MREREGGGFKEGVPRSLDGSITRPKKEITSSSSSKRYLHLDATYLMDHTRV